MNQKKITAMLAIAGCIAFNAHAWADEASQLPSDAASTSVKSAVEAEQKMVSEITIAANIPFLDESVIPTNILSECTGLGTAFSVSTANFGGKHGLHVIRKADLSAQALGDVLVIKMVTAVSSGNAFIGHHKAITAKGELYRGGKLIASVVKERSSSGGFAAGFKGSCSVLNRTVNTLGSDFIKWVKTAR